MTTTLIFRKGFSKHNMFLHHGKIGFAHKLKIVIDKRIWAM